MKLGEYLVALLEAYGVRHVFGIPGVHTVELYRGLTGRSIRHITPRHEQGAGFMADGYARVTGRPGVCFVITGPGLTNIATAMGQAYQDSIPMLVISGVNATARLGHGLGDLHELPDQGRLASCVSAFSHTLLAPAELPAVLARAFALFASARPRPVHIEIPIDVMEEQVEGAIPAPAYRLLPPIAPAAALEKARRLLEDAVRPLILAGGGARWAADELKAVAEALDAPCVLTINARGLLPPGHPLAVSVSPSTPAVQALIAQSDVVLAVGTEFGQTDYDPHNKGTFDIPGKLVRIEIDPVQMVRARTPDIGLPGDARGNLAALAVMIPVSASLRGAAQRVETARQAAYRDLPDASRRHVAFLHTIRDTLPGVAIVGDSTQAVYTGNTFYEAAVPAGWFNSATGYGTLGYALPAAIGAKLGAPDRPVVALAGDGGVQFTLGELGSAIDARAAIILIVWNNRGYGEIKSYMQTRGIAPEGVDLATPDFCAIAEAYGWAIARLEALKSFEALLRAAAHRQEPTLIEVDEAVVMRG